MSPRDTLRRLIRDAHPGQGTFPDRVDIDQRADSLYAAISDEALAKAKALPANAGDLREQIKNALSVAGAYCGDCTFEPGDRNTCADCERVWDSYATALLPLMATEDPQQAAERAALAGRVAGLTAAAQEADRAGSLYGARGDNDRAGSAYALMEKLQAMAAEPVGIVLPEASDTAATVCFDQWTTLQLTAWTAEAFGDEFVITGRLARTTVWPIVGNDVPIQRLDIPGRGALEDITARVTISNHRSDILLTIGFPAPALETP